MSKYWDTEVTATITTGKNILQYYREAGKMSVSRSPWIDKNGNERTGKTVALDIEALLESGADDIGAAREVFSEIAQLLDERAGL